MNILVINGSPSGDESITLQTMLYIEKNYPKHEYTQLNAAQQIRAMEKDFSGCREPLEQADLIVFCYPVYTFLVPAQLHRFIEMMTESGIDFHGKHATQISTSKHFYDTTAHSFINANCRDMGMTVIPGLSADMEDLLQKKGRREALAFFHHVLWSMKQDRLAAAAGTDDTGTGAAMLRKDGAAGAAALRKGDTAAAARPQPQRRIVIVTDLSGNSDRLNALTGSFTDALSHLGCSWEIVDLHEFPFSGGCLGCFHCASDGKCIYKDGFDTFLREKIQTADATVYAFTIRGHSMGYRFKLYDDRQFCNGHRTVTMGKPVGYLIDGDLAAEPDLRLLIEARAQVGGNHLAGIVNITDAADPTGNMAATGIAGTGSMTGMTPARLAAELDYAIRRHYSQPANFYGIGGMKIFRDLIYQMQGLMKEDHRFYREHGFYDDFPQKKKGTILGMYLVGAMMNNKKLRKKLGANMTAGMLMPYRRVLEKETGKGKASLRRRKRL